MIDRSGESEFNERKEDIQRAILDYHTMVRAARALTWAMLRMVCMRYVLTSHPFGFLLSGDERDGTVGWAIILELGGERRRPARAHDQGRCFALSDDDQLEHMTKDMIKDVALL